MEIRACADSELPALLATLGQRQFFADCLAGQRAGGGVLLVAWVGGTAVGDVFLGRHPAEEAEVRRWLPGVPRLIHLEVLGPFQRRGIGSALVRAGEDIARRLGHDRIALGVGLDNPGARRLYERLGFTAWGHGPIVTSWQERPHDGPPVTVTETIDMLVKRLD
jgi:GNAT superfamily N-acetyltransferase